jgi:dihydrofolate synthase/folylpolyglutamate synthase
VSGYQKALAALHRLERFGIRLGLEEMRAICAASGHPERAAPTLHVGGTNGKGTTVAVLAALGTAHGLRTGCYTSPHVLDFRERIRIDGDPISADDVGEAWSRVSGRVRENGLTYFEATTLMAFDHFARAVIDLAVVEVGLGGRLDATNVVRPEVAVVTNVARDHEPQLGRELAGIAREKAGIFKAGIPALIGDAGPEEVRRVFVEAARAAGSPLLFFEDDVRLEVWPGNGETTFDYASPDGRAGNLILPMQGAHFAWDAAVALRAWEVAGIRPLAEAAAREALSGVRPVGRAERWTVDGVPIVFDVAHNPHAMERLIAALPGGREGRTLLVLGFLSDKDWEGMLDRLAALGGRGWLCGLPGAPADRRVARPDLTRWPGLAWADTVGGALAEALGVVAAGAADRILVTGSFHTVEAAMRSLGRSGPGTLYRPAAEEPAR